MTLRWLVSIFAFATCCYGQESGGRDFSVRLFSTQVVHAVKLVPLSDNAWTASCATCAHLPLQHPLSVSGVKEVLAGGTLRLEDEESHETRTTTGLWHVRANAASHDIDIVLTLPSEQYVAAVLNAEVAAHEPAQSLQAMAILARTFALSGKHKDFERGHLPADMCDSTACQAIQLRVPSAAITEAVRRTAGETLWFDGHRADVFFSQSCGGMTEDADSIWPSRSKRPYLRSHADPFCLRRGRDTWNAQIPLTTLSTIARREGWTLPTEIAAARIVRRSSSQRALRVEFTGRNGETATISATALRFAIGRAMGWNRVRSDAYEVGVREGALIFDGHGHGHGVGLCQAGATQMAAEGRRTDEILAFYFPGTTIRITPKDSGWQEVHTDSLVIRSTSPVSTAQQEELKRDWTDVQRRFPLRHRISPKLLFAPDTELFRQLAGQPGWMLASTHGDEIVFQPEAVMQGQLQGEKATVEHELLHVAVETECNNITPLWLREGLTEVLAGENVTNHTLRTSAQIENELQHPSSQQANSAAHQAAAAKVRALIARYGVPAVRSWLASGPPKGV